jgi:hypothetical protein
MAAIERGGFLVEHVGEVGKLGGGEGRVARDDGLFPHGAGLGARGHQVSSQTPAQRIHLACREVKRRCPFNHDVAGGELRVAKLGQLLRDAGSSFLWLFSREPFARQRGVGANPVLVGGFQ